MSDNDSETRGWKHGREFSDYEKQIGEDLYEIVRFGPMSRQWWVYVGDKTLGIITGLADAKRAAHAHAREKYNG